MTMLVYDEKNWLQARWKGKRIDFGPWPTIIPAGWRIEYEPDPVEGDKDK